MKKCNIYLKKFDDDFEVSLGKFVCLYYYCSFYYFYDFLNECCCPGVDGIH